jgi:hypothetical protein
MVNARFSVLVLSAVVASGLGGPAKGQEPQHFSPKGKMPSKFTVELQEQQRKTLPFADKQISKRPSAASSLRRPTARL